MKILSNLVKKSFALSALDNPEYVVDAEDVDNVDAVDDGVNVEYESDEQEKFSLDFSMSLSK